MRWEGGMFTGVELFTTWRVRLARFAMTHRPIRMRRGGSFHLSEESMVIFERDAGVP